MRNGISLEISPHQIESLVERLPIARKLRLVRRLERETSANRLDSVVQRMRSRTKQRGISNREIERICNEVKREYDEKHRRN